MLGTMTPVGMTQGSLVWYFKRVQHMPELITKTWWGGGTKASR